MSSLSTSAFGKGDFEATCPPSDSVSCLSFSPSTLPRMFLAAGAWDNTVRLWEVDREKGKTIEVGFQDLMSGPILDVCWADVGEYLFIASSDWNAYCWDLATNKILQVAAHSKPVKTCHWLNTPNYQALMTSSWDAELKFWDLRSPDPMLTLKLPERSYSVDVTYPIAVVCTAGRHVLMYDLVKTPTEVQRMESPVPKYQTRCVAIIKDKQTMPTGFALATDGGKSAIVYFTPTEQQRSFPFTCHRDEIKKINANEMEDKTMDVYAVNDMKFHPVHRTLATVGSDMRYMFWDINKRVKLKESNKMQQQITKCAFSADGQIFAYSVCYDWSKGHQYCNNGKATQIVLHPCFEELQPRPEK